ncbi:metal ABC transporter substrate-binding protein [Streptomonospora wellingtoniae]|uniref:Metal ABC transporter substrate-binding protein n=1 Tax=Streptomonospora wellingtoniae TaxID=3075544 RepID=A0ABU2KXX4_9ACTN|nr:metal ABC transporter substrate-binding protein [Streptomonospora sp. DSM 45055]MDT0304092.1 metal ABC transporter substrate-binding protein [Streptomonospora sp. DSM 45055]
MGRRSYVKAAAACAVGVLAASGCGGGGQEADSGDRLSVVTGVYPLQWLASQVGGDHVGVENLAGAGTDPHELELAPRQIGGLQPAVDDAVSSQGGDNALDVADLVELRTLEQNAGSSGHDHGEGGHGEPGGESGHDHEESGHEEPGGEDGHDHGASDPHMWLDTERLTAAAEGLADRLSEIDPDHASDYAANAEAVTGTLGSIDTEYSEGLAECASRDIVVSHSAFGYLAHRYDLHQISPTGTDPHSEPTPARLAEVAETVREHDIGTVFTEPLGDADAAETIASETGAKTAVLDPVEGVAETSPGDDYPSIMRANLQTLTEALDCS